MEHQLGAYTDCNHGQGLAVIQPVYYRHILKDAEEKFTRFAKVVFQVDTAEEGIKALEAFMRVRTACEDGAAQIQSGDYTGGTAKSSGHLQHHKMQSA